jgi:hypothetical protein
VYSSGFVRVQMTNDTAQFFRFQDDAIAGTLTLTKAGPPAENKAPVAVLHYTRPDPEALALQGTFQDEAVEVRMKVIDPKKFPLVARGFHWVQEYPYNR